MRISLILLFGTAPSLTAGALAQSSTVANAEKIHVDSSCRILSPGQPTKTNPSPAPRYRYDRVGCHVESNLQSAHWKRIPVKGKQQRIQVQVREREYLLQNTTRIPVAFLVRYRLAKGWRIDSDPAPSEVNGQIATFRVEAVPQQIVRLHVGSRSN